MVEDHSSVRTLLRVVLEDAGYRVMEATDGPEALEVAESASPNLILLDLMMPELDGERVIANLRAGGKTAEIPIVVVTAKEEAIGRMKDLLGEANVFGKPFDQEKLLDRISRLIGPGEPAPTSPWKGPTRREI